MRYRDYGKTGFKVSALGLGCMRLPYENGTPDGSAGVDIEKSFEIIRYAAENGVNYFDTALGYHAKTSESILGEALDGGLRETVWIATKQPFTEMKTSGDIRRNLESTLKKLRSDYIDSYLIHNINASSWPGIKEREILKEYEKFKAEGLIRHIGFSYHGNYRLFREVLMSYPWEMCQVQQNMLDIHNEATEAALSFAGKTGVALVIMEPLRGGGLAQAPAAVKAVYDGYSGGKATGRIERGAAEWAFRHLLDHPAVSTILSGMTTLEQLKENIGIFSQKDTDPGCLSTEERGIIAKARAAYESIVTIPCTGCAYCMPCPKGVGIPEVFSKYNNAHRFEFFDSARRSYMFTTNVGHDAGKCVSCGQCVPKCPQGIDIPAELKVAHRELRGWKE